MKRGLELEKSNTIYAKCAIIFLVLMLVWYFGYSFFKGTHSYTEVKRQSCEKYGTQYWVNSDGACVRELGLVTCPDGGSYHSTASLCLANTDSSITCPDGYIKNNVIGNNGTLYYCSASGTKEVECRENESLVYSKYCSVGGAEWIVQGYKYTLTLNANGGSTSTSKKTCEVNSLDESCSITLGVASKLGSTFLGWDTSSSCSNPVTGSYSLSDDTTLYACYESTSSGDDSEEEEEDCEYTLANTSLDYPYVYFGYQALGGATGCCSDIGLSKYSSTQCYADVEIIDNTYVFDLPSMYSCDIFDGFVEKNDQCLKCVDNYYFNNDYNCVSDSSEEISTEYRLTIYGNEGKPPVQELSCTSTESKCVLDLSDYVEPTRNNYKLVGFANEKTNCNTTSMINVNYFNQALNVASSGTVDFYACWLENETEDTTTYTVTYNAGGGSVSPISKTVNSGETVTLPTPTKSGYTFNGWYTSASGGTKVGNAGTTYTVTGNITLYAQWIVSSYTVTYNAGGGSVSPTSQTVNSGQTVTLLTPTKSGYTFNGWYTSASGGTKVGNAGTTYTVTGNVTLYAQWTVISNNSSLKTFEVTFNPNGGTLNGNNSKSCETTSTSCIISSLPTATKSGYTFNGWSTNSSCTSGNISSITVSSDKMYYACYTKKVVNNDNNNVDNNENTTDNPQTSDIVIAFVWFFGLVAIGYAFNYFKNIREN